MARKQAVADAALIEDDERDDDDRVDARAEEDDEDSLAAADGDGAIDDDDVDDGAHDEAGAGLNVADTATSQTAKESMREQLAADVEAFLAAGGQIEEVPHDYRADPPKKPENNYGRGSI